jgi:hypothetical protein
MFWLLLTATYLGATANTLLPARNLVFSDGSLDPTRARLWLASWSNR